MTCKWDLALAIYFLAHGSPLDQESQDAFPGVCITPQQSGRTSVALFQKMKKGGQTIVWDDSNRDDDMHATSADKISLLQAERGSTGPVAKHAEASETMVESSQNTTRSSPSSSLMDSMVLDSKQPLQNTTPTIPPSGSMNAVAAVDPTDNVLEVLNLPVHADSVMPSPFSMMPASVGNDQTRALVPKEDTSAELEGSQVKMIPAVPLGDAMMTPAPPDKVDSDALDPATSLKQLVEDLAGTEIADPKSSLEQVSLFESLPRQNKSELLPLHHKRGLSHSRGWQNWLMPTAGFHAGFCIVIILAVLVFAACPRIVLKPDTDISGIKLFHDEETNKWVKVEVVGELPSGKLLLREQVNSTIFVVPIGTPLHSLDSLQGPKARVGFLEHRRYDPNRRMELRDVADTMKWLIKEILVFEDKAIHEWGGAWRGVQPQVQVHGHQKVPKHQTPKQSQPHSEYDAQLHREKSGER